MKKGTNQATHCLRTVGDYSVAVFGFGEVLRKYHPTIVKMDIESAEWNIDFNVLTNHCVKTFAIEYHNTQKCIDIHNSLCEMGYVAVKVPNLQSEKNSVGIYIK